MVRRRPGGGRPGGIKPRRPGGGVPQRPTGRPAQRSVRQQISKSIGQQIKRTSRQQSQCSVRQQLPGFGVRQPQQVITRPVVRLNEAHSLMKAGKNIQAAVTYERLARKAAQNSVARAPYLFVQSGKAFLQGGDRVRGLMLVKHGLMLLAQAGLWAQLYKVGHRTAEVFEEEGLSEEQAELESWLEEVMPADSEEAVEMKAEAAVVERPVLPTECPNCNGPLDPSLVEWRDDVTAECPYCGSMVRAED